MELNKWSFLGLLLVYCFISLILFILTSEGWSQIAMLIYLGSIYRIILVLVLLINIFIYLKKKDIRLKISWVYLIILSIVQSIALIVNRGDCGDGEGSFRFYERLLGTNSWGDCITGKEASSLPLDFISIYFFEIYTWIYILVLIAFIIQTYYKGFRKISK